MGEGIKLNFDLSCEMSSHYFKSSFAKSMAVDCIHQSRSLDYAYFGRGGVKEDRDCGSPLSDSFKKLSVLSGNVNHRSQCVEREEHSPSVISNNGVYESFNGNFTFKQEKSLIQSADVVSKRLWQVNEEASQSRRSDDSNHQRNRSSSSGLNSDTDIIKLRKECQSLLEENRRLQGALDAGARTSGRVDATVLQSQVETLQWQLKQTESSREMYRALTQQVVKFLERAHKNLDRMQSKMTPANSTVIMESPRSRVPRSRSVHTVDISPIAASAKSDSVTDFPRAKSVAQFEEESQIYNTFRDFTWRRPRPPRGMPDEVTPEKLSQEAFRLLRTAQSLLATREPDLTQRLCPTPSVGSCSSLIFRRTSSTRSSLGSATLTSGLEADFACPAPPPQPCAPPPLSASSNEDESGFSSLGSFQEVGLPPAPAPVQAQTVPLQVLWV